MSDPIESAVFGAMSSMKAALPGGGGGMGMGMGGGGGGPGGAGSGASAGPAMAAQAQTAATATITAAETLLNTQLASALSTMGDAQYFEESISPGQIRSDLAGADPSSQASTPVLLNGMKWLLASMSKGRDVADFFPHVVKLVGAPSLEVRKMVYIYLGRYADHDPTCRELALLAVNSFQRGLSDPEPLIRALALRTMTSVRVPDVLQIQILAVKRCASDSSPYVRKCAAYALLKLHPRCPPGGEEATALLGLLTGLLDHDSANMVLTGALAAFSEICPDRLDLLHPSYRKMCHLLTDMDEWGQVVVLDVLSRYCRRFFQEPRMRERGTAAVIDRERRVRRTAAGVVAAGPLPAAAEDGTGAGAGADVAGALDELFGGGGGEKKGDKEEPPLPPPPAAAGGPRKIKRRVVKKAFYSDEEDESTEEEVYMGGDEFSGLSSAMRQGAESEGFFGPGIGGTNGGGRAAAPPLAQASSGRGIEDEDEDDELDDDHRLLLRSSLPLLKSRNSAVVLAVCSLQYYCGVASIRVRSAMGRALVRIYHDKREIQYVVLTSIKTLVKECPSAFTPFLPSFFVKAMDPSFTRMIKLDILTALSLDPGSIEAVLKELRTYIGHSDKAFVRASVEAVGKVAEMARIVHDRRGSKMGQEAEARADADGIALSCVRGLTTLADASRDPTVVGECVVVMVRIMRQLLSDAEARPVADPDGVHSAVLKKILVLLVRALASPRDEDEEWDDEAEKTSADEDEPLKNFKDNVVLMPPSAVGAALSILGDWFCAPPSSPMAEALLTVDSKQKLRMRSEVLRLLGQYFADMESCEKLHGIHFASKVFLFTKAGNSTSQRSEDDVSLCEFILAMGRVDVKPDVRDRARFESNLLHKAVGLSKDTEALVPCPSGGAPISIQDAKDILLSTKSAPSHLTVEEDDDSESQLFRFGSLSSLMSHSAGKAYILLPPWATEDSPSSLREPPESESTEEENINGEKVRRGQRNSGSSFFGDSSTASSHSSSSGESSSGESSSGESSSSGSSSGSSEYTTSSGDEMSSSGDEHDESDSSSEDSSDESSDDDNAVVKAMKASSVAVVTGTSAAVLTPPAYKKGSVIERIKDGRRGHIVEVHPDSSGVAYYTVVFDDGREGNVSEENLRLSLGGLAGKANLLDTSLLHDEDGEESSVETSSGDDDSSSSPSSGPVVSNDLLDMINAGARPTVAAPASASSAPKINSEKASSTSSLIEGLEGLVMAPLAVDGGGADEEEEAIAEVESSLWETLVRPDLSGGLKAKARFIRGRTREKEAQLIGLDTAAGAVSCIQIRFKNMRSDSGILRRVRIVQRSAGGVGYLAPRRVIVPQEIVSLKQGQSSTVMLWLQFSEVSDKDRFFLSKLEIKSDRGSTPVEIRPSLGENLLPCRMNQSQFEAALGRLKRMAQPTVASFSLASSSSGRSIRQLHEALPTVIVKEAQLSPIDKSMKWKPNGSCDFVALLPASQAQVLVTLSADLETGSGKIVVLCDDMMASNAIAGQLKRAASK